ncbi:radical SAM protein [Dehalogenimonas alkenigignens]|uniref:radical SAM protein n=1 Tax=Dehalogenimonas alkenigignens TaxID=1217799 RepID=UPI000D57B9BC|nr:radical SAM protein [Dehalogenimonas alkenigignens]PVV84512.1 radical SAM protein [Dehalogenimonas alkenigignens]
MKTCIYHITYTPEQKDVCVHFWGCNFQCRGCYCSTQIYSPMLDFGGMLKRQPEVLARPPEKFLTLAEVEAILDKLDFHSVVIEGQEAGLDPAYPAFTEMLRRRYGARVTLVTNAAMLPDLTFTDTVEVGLKAMDDRLHLDYTGASNRPTLENFDRLIAMAKKIVVDTVLIPGYIDAAEVERVAEFVASRDPCIPFILLPYFPVGNNPWRRATAEEMDQAAGLVRKHLSRVFHFRGDEALKYPIYNVFPAEACPGAGADSARYLAAAEGLNRRPDQILHQILEPEEVSAP